MTGVVHVAGAFDARAYTQTCARCGALLSDHPTLAPLRQGQLVLHFTTHTRLADRRLYPEPTCSPNEGQPPTEGHLRP